MAYYVYMLLASGCNGTLYLGVTNDLVRRIYVHKNKITRGFTSRYGVDRLVWFEVYDDPESAIARERKRDQEVAAGMEIASDREVESAVDRLVSANQSVA